MATGARPPVVVSSATRALPGGGQRWPHVPLPPVVATDARPILVVGIGVATDATGQLTSLKLGIAGLRGGGFAVRDM